MSLDCSVYCHQFTERKKSQSTFPGKSCTLRPGRYNHGYYIRLYVNPQGRIRCFLFRAVWPAIYVPAVREFLPTVIHAYVSARKKAGVRIFWWSDVSDVKIAIPIIMIFQIVSPHISITKLRLYQEFLMESLLLKMLTPKIIRLCRPYNTDSSSCRSIFLT